LHDFFILLKRLLRHNDLANNIIGLANGQLANVDLGQNLTSHPLWQDCMSCHTDIPRLRAGMVGAQVTN